MTTAPTRERRWIGPVVLFLITTGFFWKLVLTNQYTWMGGNDMARQVLPWFQFQVGEIQAGRLPLWDPYVLGGQPLIGQAQPGTAYPGNWLLFVLPTRHGWIKQIHLHWYYVLIHFLAALFAYWLCRDLKCGRGASLVGGSLYGLGGFMGGVDWPQMLNGAVWGPLVLMYTLRSARGQRPWGSAALGGMCLGISVLSGHHQAPTFIGLAMVGVWLWAVFRNGRLDRAMLARFALFVAIAGLTSGLQSLPAYEYSQNAYRWAGAPAPIGPGEKVPYKVHSDYSLQSFALLGVVFPGIHRHADPYVGFTAVLLGLLGCAMAWGRRETRICAAIAAGGLLYSLGSDVVFQGILYSLAPGVEKARNPSMAVLVFHLGLAALAALGVDRIGKDRESRWLLRGEKAAIGLGLVVLACLYAYFLQYRGEFYVDTRSAVTALVALLVAAILFGRRQGQLGHSAMVTLLLGLMLIELGNGAMSMLPHTLDQLAGGNLARMAQDKPLVDTLRSLPGGYRAEMSEQDFPHNVGDWNGIDVWHGYLASLPKNLYKMHMAEHRVRMLYGVGYLVARQPEGGWNREVATLHADLKVFRNQGAFPRVWAVHEVAGASEEAEVSRVLADREFDLRRKAVVQGEAPKLETCTGEDDVWLLRRVSNQVRIFADLACTGMVILSDNWYPGWVATVDGDPARLYEVNGALRGVVVPGGGHMIEIRYRPRSVYWGFLMTVAGVVAALSVRRAESRRSALSATDVS